MRALIKYVTALAGAAGLLAAGAGTATAGGNLAWRDCYDGLACAEIRVPADWDHPAGGDTVTVPLLKIPARETKLGSLLVNPGGPARSIPNFALPGYRDQFADLAARFDVVVFDPRGLDVTCPAPVPVALPVPLVKSAYDVYAAANARFAAGCAPAKAGLRGHLDARQVAHDMDAIRAGLGEQRLTYFGSSYGTVYGQAYAGLFGRRVGRMYLDSTLDHTRPDPVAWTRAGAVTAERNLFRMAGWCAADAGCALHGRDVIYAYEHGLLNGP
jgi:pimeloyl-ACP methyl ester carboxylesterase